MAAASGAVGGALTGAKLGSFGGPVGIGVGTGLGALGGWMLGRKKKKPSAEEQEEAALQSDIAGLRESAGEKREQAGALSSMGTEALAPVLNYFKAILGSDPGALMEATKPERGRVIDQYDAARRSAAQFGARGGGTNAAISESYMQQANQLSDITSMAKRDATTQLGELGATLTGLGLSAEQLASADLNMVINAVLGRQQLALEKRGQTMGLFGDIGTAAGSVLGAVLTRGKD